MRYLWEIEEADANSGLIWRVVSKKLKPGGSISRASVIFTMNRFVVEGVLGWRDATGKGGHHKVYYPLMDEKRYEKYLIKTMIESMRRDFPEETKKFSKSIDEIF